MERRCSTAASIPLAMPERAMTYQPARDAQPASSSGGLDIKTLFYTAASSAAAAYVCSKVWAPGTLAAAAFTPVLVALIKEALTKSTDVVTRAVPVKGVVRSARPEDPQQPYDATLQQPVGEMALQAPPAGAERVPQAGEVTYHGSGRMRGWRLAVVTGLAGFLICAVVFTVPELVAGGSAAGGGRDTTLFGGARERDRDQPAVTTQTTTTEVRTVTQPPARTVTVPAPRTVTTPPAQTTTTPPPATPTDPVPGEPEVAEPPAAQPPG